MRMHKRWLFHSPCKGELEKYSDWGFLTNKKLFSLEYEMEIRPLETILFFIFRQKKIHQKFSLFVCIPFWIPLQDSMNILYSTFLPLTRPTSQSLSQDWSLNSLIYFLPLPVSFSLRLNDTFLKTFLSRRMHQYWSLMITLFWHFVFFFSVNIMLFNWIYKLSKKNTW